MNLARGAVGSNACETTLAAPAEAGGKPHTEEAFASARTGWKLDTVSGTTPEIIVDWKPGEREGTTSAEVDWKLDGRELHLLRNWGKGGRGDPYTAVIPSCSTKGVSE